MDLRFNNLDTDGAVKLGEIVHKIEEQLLLNEGKNGVSAMVQSLQYQPR